MRRKPGGRGNEDERLHAAFGRALKVLRAERGMERKELADGARLSYAYVSEIESGKKRPSSRALLVLADALGVRPHELMAFAERFEEGAAAASAPARRAIAPSGAWDASQVALQRLSPHPEPLIAFARPPHADERAGALAELAELAATLDDDDVRCLLDLARRLAR